MDEEMKRKLNDSNFMEFRLRTPVSCNASDIEMPYWVRFAK